MFYCYWLRTFPVQTWNLSNQMNFPLTKGYLLTSWLIGCLFHGQLLNQIRQWISLPCSLAQTKSCSCLCQHLRSCGPQGSNQMWECFKLETRTSENFKSLYKEYDFKRVLRVALLLERPSSSRDLLAAYLFPVSHLLPKASFLIISWNSDSIFPFLHPLLPSAFLSCSDLCLHV